MPSCTNWEVEDEVLDAEVLIPEDDLQDLPSEDQHLAILEQYRQNKLTDREIAQEFERLIYFVIKRYQRLFTPHLLIDEADCYNICLFKLFKVIETHDPSRGKFTTYVVRSMTNALVEEYKYMNRTKRKGYGISLDTFMVEENLANVLFYKYASVEFLPEVMSKELKRNVIDIIQGLPASDRTKQILMETCIHQKSPSDISMQYDVSRQAVSFAKKTYLPRMKLELQKRQLI